MTSFAWFRTSKNTLKNAVNTQPIIWFIQYLVCSVFEPRKRKCLSRYRLLIRKFKKSIYFRKQDYLYFGTRFVSQVLLNGN